MKKLLLLSFIICVLCMRNTYAAIDSTKCSVQFTVDMSYQIKKGLFTAGTDFIDVAGDFNSWSGGNAYKFTKVNDSVYTLRLDNIAVGNVIGYKFRINGSWSTPAKNEFNGGANRLLAPRPLKSAGVIQVSKFYDDKLAGYMPLYLKVDMSGYVFNGKFNPTTDFVDVAGDFNSWNGSEWLYPEGKNIYSIMILAKPGSQGYKFRINGTWSVVSKNEFDGGANRTFTVKDTTGGVKNTADLAYYNSTQPVILNQLSWIAPQYPKVNDQIAIYVNTKKLPDFDQKSDLSAWTGLITSESKDAKDDWKNNPISDWNNLSVKLTRFNDSIHIFFIPSIKDLYKIDPTKVEIFRIAFIARDSAKNAVHKQTENIYYEVYGSKGIDTLILSQPQKPLQSKPYVLTFNITKATKTPSLYQAMKTGSQDSTIYLWTGVKTEAGDWQKNPVLVWGDLNKYPKFRALKINDSIYRFFMFPNARTFFNITDTCVHINGQNMVIRNFDGSAQAEDLFVQFDTSSYKKCTTQEVVSITKNELYVFPNPAEEILTVKSPVTISDVNVTNITGQVIFRLSSVNKSDLAISLNGIKSGIYFITVRSNDNKVSSLKFIKK